MLRGTILVLMLSGTSVLASASPHECKTQPTMSVNCSRASALVQVQVANCRKLGNVVLEVKDSAGRVLYREEGKAMTGELVRRLDKGVFPKGTHTLTILAKDLALSQAFTIE